jgi:hypothetical protein
MKFILIPSVSWKMFGRVGDLIDKWMNKWIPSLENDSA